MTRSHAYASVSGKAFQSAVDAAQPGDRLKVQGRCVGDFNVDADLTIAGAKKEGYPVAKLYGKGTSAVLTIAAAAVSIKNLTISHGTSSGAGGGIHNGGTLTLSGSTRVVQNSASSAGGIWNGGTLTLTGNATVSGNTTTGGRGGGIVNWGPGELVLNGRASVSGNEATANHAGGIWSNGGAVTLNDSAAVTGNTSAALAGGILIEGGGILNLNGASLVSGNQASMGGGIADYASVYMGETASIAGNTATGNGGGVFVAPYESSELSMAGSATITSNTASDGGGIYSTVGSLSGIVAGGNVSGNAPNDVAP